MFSFQIFVGSRPPWASCEFNTHRRRRRDADATQLDSWVASASASAVCRPMGHNIVPKFPRCIVRFSIGYSIVSDTKSFTCATGEWWQTDKQTTDRHREGHRLTTWSEGLTKVDAVYFRSLYCGLAGDISVSFAGYNGWDSSQDAVRYTRTENWRREVEFIVFSKMMDIPANKWDMSASHSS